jgi:hypothetical protein
MLRVVTPVLTATMCIMGVSFLLLALLFEFLELRADLHTLGIEIPGALKDR